MSAGRIPPLSPVLSLSLSLVRMIGVVGQIHDPVVVGVVLLVAAVADQHVVAPVAVVAAHRLGQQLDVVLLHPVYLPE